MQFDFLQFPVFNLTFYIVIYYPATSNNCNNVVPPVLLLYFDTSAVLEQEQPYIAQFSISIINWKHINISAQ